MRYDDVRVQSDRLYEANSHVIGALRTLSQVAKDAARGYVELDQVYAAGNAVRRAEEARDLAQLDLDTARGADA